MKQRNRDSFSVLLTRREADKLRAVSAARGMAPEALIEELIQDGMEELRAELMDERPARGTLH